MELNRCERPEPAEKANQYSIKRTPQLIHGRFRGG
jgi:hypothetical protein